MIAMNNTVMDTCRLVVDTKATAQWKVWLLESVMMIGQMFDMESGCDSIAA